MQLRVLNKVHLVGLLGVSTILSTVPVRAFAAPASPMTSTSPTKAAPSPLLSIPLRKVTAEAAPLGPRIESSALYKPNGAIVFVVRRPGCVLCREEAMDLSTQLAPRLKGLKKKVNLVAVVAETTSVDGFLDAFKVCRGNGLA